MRARLVTAALVAAALGVATPAAAVATPAGKPSYETWISDVGVIAEQLEGYLTSRLTTPGEKTAITLDIDNTTLETAYHPQLTTPAIKSMLKAVRLAKSKGAAVFFITNRPEALGLPTKANLVDVDYPVDGLYLRPWFNFEPTEKVKTDARKAVEAKGYKIVANVGNNTWDLAGGHAERTFKLPDYNGALD
ncbi:HAD family acid phosphatase [Allokutzneria albata]|uniref:HAD superfamily, subfamily IIIB (Acid phosphatase) n=1 Tax=Allokutzneria albata TaxID=211114 RepID=A0A1G9XBL5_ALLAB|nr:HAD family acid phosphatase [Allokutzneria albata]SDM94128.1 HAD superfamily, subfamily IIIB (Acid phosphatase) [Allokutzneria albata]